MFFKATTLDTVNPNGVSSKNNPFYFIDLHGLYVAEAKPVLERKFVNMVSNLACI